MGRVSYILFIVATFKYFKQDYRTLVFAAVLSNVVVAVLAVIIERKQWFSFSNRGEIKTPMREMIKFGMPLILSMSITWILQSTDKFFVSAYNGYLELGIYSSAFTIVAIINSVQESFITFWVPVANEKYKESPENTEFFSKVNSIVSMLMLLIGVGIITFKDIIVILLGSKYRDAIFIFPVLALMPIMYTISETTVIGINFKKKTRYHIITSLIAAVANIIGNMILVPVLGAKGAAISTGISYMIFFIVRTVISQRFYYVDYNLKRLYISVSTLVVLAVYSSFNSTNIKSILLSFISLTVILLLYKFVILDLINLLKKRKQEAI